MTRPKLGCLILACGNTLRSDDGAGPRLAAWAEDRFGEDPRIRVISRQQWTPDLAEDIAAAESVLFLDCSVESAPGEIRIAAVEPLSTAAGIATHHTGGAELLALAQELYGAIPRASLLLTVGAGSTELGEILSPSVEAALPEACGRIEQIVRTFLV
jgi:hydrogenase maturation protease